MKKDNREHALFNHRRLPRRLWRKLREAGFPDDLIHRRLIGWDGKRITVPVFSRDRKFLGFEFLTDPLEERGFKEVAHLRYYPARLYGFETLEARPARVILVQGVWDRLVLESRGFKAVGIIGDPHAFRVEWHSDLQAIGQVFVCFKKGGAGHRAAARVSEIVHHARLVELPVELPAGAGVSDYFLSLGRSRDDFLKLLLKESQGYNPPESHAA